MPTGTPAARMPQMPMSIRKERAARLREAGQIEVSAFLQSHVGRTENVLVENARTARTAQFAEVRLDHDAEPGRLARVRITGADHAALHGAL